MRTGRFTHSTAIVAGAAGTIGRAAARRLATERAAVLVVDRDRDGIDQRVAEIESDEGISPGFVADVTDASSVQAYLRSGKDVAAAMPDGGAIVNAASSAGVTGFPGGAGRPRSRELWRRMTSLEGVTPGYSNISAPSSHAVHLDAVLARGPRQAYLTETEFAHLHGDGSGTLHLTLPQARGAEAIAQGWGEAHPAARMGIAPPTLLMLYAPRDARQLAIVWQLIQESYAYARGGQIDRTRTVATGSRAAFLARL